MLLRLFHAGLVAAAYQLAAVTFITLVFILPAFHGTAFQRTPSIPKTTEAVWNDASPFLIWSYLVIATAIVFTDSSFTTYTARSVRAAVCGHHHRDFVLKQLLVCLAIPSIIIASFALEPPPAFLFRATSYFGCTAATSSIWGAAMSVVAVCLGAMAHAINRALDW